MSRSSNYYDSREHSDQLTDTEIEVVLRLGMGNKDIALDLGIKLRTVEKHIECILKKLQVPNRTAAVLKVLTDNYAPATGLCRSRPESWIGITDFKLERTDQ